MQIEYLKYENFFSVGQEPVEVKFSSYGNIVLINGINKDIHKDDELVENDGDGPMHSNAAGKSTIVDALFYGLYGDFIRKKVNQADAINQKTKKNLSVEVIFHLKGFFYRIIRTRKVNSLKLWKSKDSNWCDDNEITEGGIPATQKEINNIIGLNGKAFTNILYFGQHNETTFLGSEAKDKREIAESLLSIDAFKKCADLAKDKSKDIKKEFKTELNIYDSLKTEEMRCAARLESLKKQNIIWGEGCDKDILRCHNNILECKKQLDSQDTDGSQKELSDATESLEAMKIKQSKFHNALIELKPKHREVDSHLHQINLAKRTINQQINSFSTQAHTYTDQIKQLNNLESGVICDACYGVVDPNNALTVIQKNETKKQEVMQSIEDAKSKLNELEVKHKKMTAAEVKIAGMLQDIGLRLQIEENNIVQTNNVVSKLSKKQTPAAENIILQEKIKYLQDTLKEKENEKENGSPYLKLIDETNLELDDKISTSKQSDQKIKDMEDLIPYFEWWVKGYSDGIRSFIIDDILPSLNDRINYWLEILANGKIQLRFDNYLEPTIERNPSDGNKFLYSLMSGGLKKRVDLAILHSFADVMMLSSETMPSVIFLDEIGNDFDLLGKHQVYNMIMEFSQQRQVFIITHDSTLLEMLGETDTITVQLEDGITTKI